LHVPKYRAEPFCGEEIIRWTAEQTRGQVSVHHGHMPIITLSGPDEASGIWAMEDRLYRSAENPLEGGGRYLHGFGHYHERYVRLARGGRIRGTRLTPVR